MRDLAAAAAVRQMMTEEPQWLLRWLTDRRSDPDVLIAAAGEGDGIPREVLAAVGHHLVAAARRSTRPSRRRWRRYGLAYQATSRGITPV